MTVLIRSYTCICMQCHEQVTYHHGSGKPPITQEEALRRLCLDGWTRDGNRWSCRFCSLMDRVETHLATLPEEERRILLDPLEEPADVCREELPQLEQRAITGTFEVYRAGKRMTVPAKIIRRSAGKSFCIEYLYHGTHGHVVQRWLRKPSDYARFTPDPQGDEGEKGPGQQEHQQQEGRVA